MSTKKTFGEYLVEKQLITEQALLESIFEQVKAAPSVAEVVYAGKLLTSKQLIAAFALQSQEGLEFCTACEKLGFWTKEIQQQVYHSRDFAHKAIGEILIHRHAITYESFVHALDSYLDESSDAMLMSTSHASAATAPLECVPPKAASVSPTNPLATEFCEQFDASALADLMGPTSAVANVRESINKALQTSHRLAGSAQFAKIGYLHEFFTTLEGSLRTVSAFSDEQIEPKNSAKWLIIYKMAVELAWDIRNQMMDGAPTNINLVSGLGAIAFQLNEVAA